MEIAKKYDWELVNLVRSIAEARPQLVPKLVQEMCESVALALRTSEQEHRESAHSLVQCFLSVKQGDKCFRAKAIQDVLNSMVILGTPFEKDLKREYAELKKDKQVFEYLDQFL